MFAFFRFVFLFILTVFVLVVGSSWLGITYLAPKYVTGTLHRATQFPAESSPFSFNPFKPSLSLETFVVFNSPDFMDEAFLDISSARVVLDPSASRDHQLVLDEVHLALRTLTIVRNSEGDVNAKVFSDRALNLAKDISDSFNDIRNRLGPPAQDEVALKTLIKTCHLSLDKVVVIDYKDRSDPYVRTFDLGFDLEVHDVEDLSVVIAPLVKELNSVVGAVVVDAVLYSINRLSLGLFSGELFGQAGKVVEGVSSAGGKVVKGAAQAGGKVLQGTGKIFKGLLGGGDK